MKHSRVPWATKLRPDMTHDVTRDPKGRGQLLPPTPMFVAQEISTIPPGALMTFPVLRARLAEQLREERHIVQPRRNKLQVIDYEQRLLE